MIGMLVAYNDDALLQSMSHFVSTVNLAHHVAIATGTAAQSPFVIAMNRAGVKGKQQTAFNMWMGAQQFSSVFPHIINACVFTSAFSSGNSFLFCASRVLYGLALRGQAPRYLTYCTKKGLPFAALCTSVSDY